MARRFAKVLEEEIEEAFFCPSDLVNTKTTIPLRVGEERWIHTSTLRVSVYIHHYSPPLRGIVVYYITGDFNLDLLKHESHSVTAQFIESLFAFSSLPMITKPTRITTHSATLIDNMFTNNLTVSSRNCLIISDISDHLPIFSIVFGDHLRKDSNSFTFRVTSEKRVNEFRHKLENTNWNFSDQVNIANDPNTAYNIFIDKYTGLFDACFPFKTIKGKALNSFRKPWLTKSLLRSINKKNKLYKQYLRHRSNEKLLKYKTYKNKLTDPLRVAKRL